MSEAKLKAATAKVKLARREMRTAHTQFQKAFAKAFNAVTEASIALEALQTKRK